MRTRTLEPINSTIQSREIGRFSSEFNTRWARCAPSSGALQQVACLSSIHGDVHLSCASQKTVSRVLSAHAVTVATFDHIHCHGCRPHCDSGSTLSEVVSDSLASLAKKTGRSLFIDLFVCFKSQIFFCQLNLTHMSRTAATLRLAMGAEPQSTVAHPKKFLSSAEPNVSNNGKLAPHIGSKRERCTKSV